jgi:hypothetical protein
VEERFPGKFKALSSDPTTQKKKKKKRKKTNKKKKTEICEIFVQSRNFGDTSTNSRAEDIHHRCSQI